MLKDLESFIAKEYVNDCTYLLDKLSDDQILFIAEAILANLNLKERELNSIIEEIEQKSNQSEKLKVVDITVHSASPDKRRRKEKLFDPSDKNEYE